MWALGVIVIIALVIAFLVLDSRSRPGRAVLGTAGQAEVEAPPTPAPAEAQQPEPTMRRAEDVERDVYRELYAERSGEVSRRRTAAS